MKRIIIDTNFLLLPLTNGVDIYDEIKRIMEEKYKLYILDETRAELARIIEEQSGKDKQAAKVALQMLSGRVEEIPTMPGHADDLIVQEVDENTIVATQDRELKKRVKAAGGRVIVCRKGQYLELQ